MGNLSSIFRFYRYLIKTSLKQSLSLKSAFLLRVIFMVFNNAMMLVAWGAMFYRFNSINGWVFNDFMFMTGLCVASFSIWPLFFRGAGIYLARLIEYGDLDPYLLQPRNVLFNVSCSVSDPSGFGDLITGIIFICLSGLLTVSSFPIVLLCFICAVLCFLAVTICVSSLPFFVKNSDDLGERIFYIFFNIAGYPGSIYSGWAKLALCSLFPVGIISVLPIELLKHFSIATCIYMFVFSLCFFSLSVWIFHRGLRCYESGSRFGVHGQ